MMISNKTISQFILSFLWNHVERDLPPLGITAGGYNKDPIKNYSLIFLFDDVIQIEFFRCLVFGIIGSIFFNTNYIEG